MKNDELLQYKIAYIQHKLQCGWTKRKYSEETSILVRYIDDRIINYIDISKIEIAQKLLEDIVTTPDFFKDYSGPFPKEVCIYKAIYDIRFNIGFFKQYAKGHKKHK